MMEPKMVDIAFKRRDRLQLPSIYTVLKLIKVNENDIDMREIQAAEPFERASSLVGGIQTTWEWRVKRAVIWLRPPPECEKRSCQLRICLGELHRARAWCSQCPHKKKR